MYNGNSMPQITSISTSHLKKAVTIATTSREAILASFDIRPKKKQKKIDVETLFPSSEQWLKSIFFWLDSNNGRTLNDFLNVDQETNSICRAR